MIINSAYAGGGGGGGGRVSNPNNGQLESPGKGRGQPGVGRGGRSRNLRPPGRQNRRGNENSQRPGRVITGPAVFAGNGCPQETMRVVFAPDNLSFSILFDQFVAEVSQTKIRRDVLNCDVIVPIQLPQSTQMEITRVDLRGFVNLPAHSRAVLYSMFNFRGARGEGNHMVLNYNFAGPLTDNYELSSDALSDDNQPTSEISPCGGTVNLAVRNRLSVVTRRPGESAMVTIDSIDGAGHAIYYVNWRSCQ